MILPRLAALLAGWRHRPLITDWIAAALALTLGLAGRAGAQEVVSGTVVDAATGRALDNAFVAVEGTRARVTTDAQGRFRIAVPRGEVGLVVTRLGYKPVTVTVQAGSGEVIVAMAPVAVALDEVVVTGTPGGEQRRAIGNAVGTIDAALELQRSAAPNLGSLLQARVPGVIITPGTGRVGAGPTVQIRGRSTLSLTSEPIVYVDGVRVNNAVNQGPSGSTAGGPSLASQNSQVASRLNDVALEDIQSIEIIRGPAAATIYGTEAANGVVQIITKRGAGGRPRWAAKIAQGAVWFANAEERIPTNYARDPATSQPVPWNPIKQEQDRGTPIFRTGRTQSYNLALSGGGEQAHFYLSGTFNDDEGIEPNNSGRSFSGHANLGVTPSEKVDVATSLHYHRSAAHLGADGGLSPMLGMSIGHPITNPSTRGFGFAPPEVPQLLYDNAQDVNRYTASATVTHRPALWFRQRLTMGLDYTSDDSRALERYAPPELRPYLAPFGSTVADGRIGQTLRNETYITGDYSGTATFTLTPSVELASSVGGQFVRKQLKSSFLSGIVFPGPGLETVSGTTTRGQPSQSLLVNTTIGAYAQQRLGWHDRLFLTGAVRVDNNSAFGADFDLVTYPKVSATWVISEESFWRGLTEVVSTLKLRAAYGQSGQQPNTFAALRTLTNAPRANGTPGVTQGSPGNADLKPERARELEVGFEAGLFDRLALDVTYYTRRTRDAILGRIPSPSSGFADTQFVNIGATSNRGVELQARLQAVMRENVSWEISGNISTNKDRVEDLGGVPFVGGGILRSVEGYPIQGFWTRRIASADRDPVTHAVSNILCESGSPSDGTPVACAQALPVFVGTQTPKLIGAISNTVTLRRRVTLYALLDFKRGHKLLNANNVNRCDVNVCPPRFFPERYSTAYLASIAQSSRTAGVVAHEIQDASFLKLREVSLMYQLPERWLRGITVSSAALVIAARNLVTWTDYDGIDPEVRYQGTTPQDQGLVPALTQLVVTLNLGF